MADIYVDWSAAGGQDSGTGTQGDPYGSIVYALTQQAASQADLAVLGGLTVHVDDSASTGMPSNDAAINLSSFSFTNGSTTNRLIVRAGDNKRPTGAGPQLELTCTTDNAYLWTVSGAVLDGFYIHDNGGLANQTMFDTGTAGTDVILRNCELFAEARAFGTSAFYVGYHIGFIAENCLFRGGREWMRHAGTASTGTVRNCVFVGQAVADAGLRLGSALAVYSCAFMDVLGQAVDAGITGAGNAIDGSVQGQAGIWAVDGTLQESDFADFANGDYRAASGGALVDAGDVPNSSTSDMFGTARDETPDIGFFEVLAAASVGLLQQMHYYYS